MSNHFDHIVIGIGGMGSATLLELARRGHRVLGLEQFDVSHQMGASHGLTRIIRLAYNEHPDYVPLLRRSYEQWRQLEHDQDVQLLVMTGGLDIGPGDGRVVSGALDSCRLHDIAHTAMAGADLNRNYPAFNVPSDYAAVFHSEAGYLRPERSVIAHVQQALALGAQVRGRETVLGFDDVNGVYTVTTSKGRYETPSLVITAGPWAGKLMPELAPIAQAQRQVVGWFQPESPQHFVPPAMPVFILDCDEGEYYGFPIDQEMPGFKIGRFYHRHEAMDPDRPRLVIDAEDEAILRDALRRYLPHANGPTFALQHCVFTLTPDRHFILDTLPGHPGVTVGAGFSGHGFKFAPVVGEILADLADDGRTAHNIGLFKADRFS